MYTVYTVRREVATNAQARMVYIRLDGKHGRTNRIKINGQSRWKTQINKVMSSDN